MHFGTLSSFDYVFNDHISSMFFSIESHPNTFFNLERINTTWKKEFECFQIHVPNESKQHTCQQSNQQELTHTKYSMTSWTTCIIKVQIKQKLGYHFYQFLKKWGPKR